MQARYGLDRRPVGRWIAVGVVVLAFTGILIGVGALLGSRDSVQASLITWGVVAPDRVDLTFTVRPDPSQDVRCVLRAQDSTRADVGYAVAVIPPAPDGTPVMTSYALRTLAPAYVVELLGCATGTDPAGVPPPQFPPGVVPPEQPWTAPAP